MFQFMTVGDLLKYCVAFKSVLRRNSHASPWKVAVPLFVSTRIVLAPISVYWALKLFCIAFTSVISSGFGVTIFSSWTTLEDIHRPSR